MLLIKDMNMETTRWKRQSWVAVFVWACGVITWGGCGPEPTPAELKKEPQVRGSFEEFMKGLPRTEDGVYLVEQDVPIRDEAALRKYHEGSYYDDVTLLGTSTSSHTGRFTAQGEPRFTSRRDGLAYRSRWPEQVQHSIGYCINPIPTDCNGADKATPAYIEVKDALAKAAREWERWANVRFVHLEEKDVSCGVDTQGVEFDVQVFCSYETVSAVSFHPGAPRAERVLRVNWREKGRSLTAPSLNHLMLHELGHALGFVHEHERGIQGYAPWFEECVRSPKSGFDVPVTDLTGYDAYSVMHYRDLKNQQCPNAREEFREYRLSRLDQEGARSLYPFE